MLYYCEFSCRDFEYYDFPESELEPDSKDGSPTEEAMQTMYDDFAKVVHRELSVGRWGPVNYVEVDVGEDNVDYQDSTQIEYFFRVGCTLTEEEVEVEQEADSETDYPTYLIPEATIEKLTDELRQLLGVCSFSSCEIETTEPTESE